MIELEKYKRWELIQYYINKTQTNNYLEIGCDNNKVFKKIRCKNKIGVDPVRGGTHRMTSDDFFKNNIEYFGVIFIDGLHHYDQVKKDVNNSLEFLDKDGYIVIHDMIPLGPEYAIVPRPLEPKTWMGDVWRLSFYLKEREDVRFKIVKIDCGCGVLQKTSKKCSTYKEVKNDFSILEKNLHLLPIVSYDNK